MEELFLDRPIAAPPDSRARRFVAVPERKDGFAGWALIRILPRVSFIFELEDRLIALLVTGGTYAVRGFALCRV